MRCFKILTTAWRENAEDWSPNGGALGGRCSFMNSLVNAATRHIGSPVAAKKIHTPVCFTSVLLCFNRRMAYWTHFANEMLDLVRPVSRNVAFFVSAALCVYSPILMKPAQATLKALSTLRSVIERSSSSVIFSRISFVIGRLFRFLQWNSLLPPLMMSIIRWSSKPPRLRRLLMWYNLRPER